MPDTTIIENLLSLSADEFGKEVLRQSDRTQRDEQVWTVIISEEMIYQARDALRHMKGVNELARKRRKEELEMTRADFIQDSGAMSRQWRTVKSEHDAWQARSGRFANRVNMALCEIKAVLRDRQEGTPEGFLQELLSAVLAHRGDVLDDDYEPTRHDTLLWKIADGINDQMDWVRE
jgi:hypothetical protein